MKNVLLVGDSIRKGYDKSVRKTLEGKANVYFPEDNCRFAAYTYRLTAVCRNLLPEGEDFDVIHWNAGLWDCLHMVDGEPLTPLDIYAYYIERICQQFKKICPNAKVIFATSTRVQSEKMNKPFKRYNEEIEKYNETAVAIVKKYGFAVNDLYAVSAALPEEAHSDATHYNTSLGTEAFTNQVLSYLVPALGITEDIHYQEVLRTDAPIGV